ncbi:sugar ABC transporter substrate-binding protein [Paracoccus aurantiacus]|uniref:Sugar ABC transporter substrate-binding protein n=1 Tax=Paracoccus aurantiacus TaxID=2599412 RepID=A0A5C6RMM4_9RHOB|nr:sugar ABC transporter substrate-binding protein [Paracoccus aurantiacus]TXB63661.1 sugar ABC transporter substrate-binding protein [Paracoccus aurantiacus]
MQKFLTMTALLASTAFAGPALAETRVAVSMTAFDNPFLTIIREAIGAEAEDAGEVEVAFEDAQLDVARQLDQVNNFIASGYDAIIVNPVDGNSTTAITQAATSAGIPLVYVNHPPGDVDALPEGVSFVGSNEIDSGTMQTQQVCELLGGKGDVLVMVGPLENHSAIIRTKDIHDVIATPECSGMTVVEEQTANWNRAEAQDLMTNWLTSGVQFDAVIANNDEMAIGAILAMKAAGMNMDDVVVAGIDATPDGLMALASGDLDVTVFQNAAKQGQVALQTAISMAGGTPAERNIWIPFEPVTRENMGDYQ